MNSALHDAGTPISDAAVPTKARAGRWLGGLLIAEALFAFAPVAVLGPAIGWPASLRSPAAVQLAAIADHPGALSLGYGLYLAYSLLIAPVLIGLAARTLGSLARPLAATVVAFAALSALARSIGILRWLTVMPVLAQRHAGAEPTARASIELVFDALTSYGGGIGELLGVSVFMAMALLLLCGAAWRHDSMPKWLAGLGLSCGVLLALIAAPALGLPLAAPMALAATLLSVWMLLSGMWVWGSAKRKS